jgi:putative SOS response-associated peptidase YedK
MYHHGRPDDAFKRTRCLIPVSGYYEWQDHSLTAEETVTDVEGWEFTPIGGRPYFRSFAEAKAVAQAHLDPLRVERRGDIDSEA